MKLIVALVSSFALCGGATAQTTPCQTIPKAADRLACYDRVTPPMAAPSAATSKGAAKSSSAEQAQKVDMLAAENSKLDAKLKTICRGC